MKKIAALLFILMLVTAGCANGSNKQKSGSSEKLSIYTSIYPLQYLTEKIGGDAVSVQSVYPPGVDAHTFEPTSKTITDIAKSDAFIYMGAGMEGFAETTADALKNQDTKMVEIAKNDSLFIEAKFPHDHEHGDGDHEAHEEHGHDEHGDKDPHVWLDPLKMVTMGEQIQKELSALDPKHKADFEKNFQALKENMTALDKEFKETLKGKKQHHILVSHAAYGYWERYGIEQLPIRGISTSDEPSQKDLAKITRLAEKDHLKYVIYEKNEPDKLADIIKKHIHAKTLEIHNLEVLTDQDMKQNKDYLALMKENLKVLDQATK